MDYKNSSATCTLRDQLSQKQKNSRQVFLAVCTILSESIENDMQKGMSRAERIITFCYQSRK